MVAGRVALRYEVPAPIWIRPFEYLLSAFDRGDTNRALPPYETPVGCNMSLRKSVFFEVGGFNPDGFGDQRLLHFRGDGECGLARKVHDAGLTVWYSADAWLEHRVPRERITRRYMERRSQLAGIEIAYCDLRYSAVSLARLAIRGGVSFSKVLFHFAAACLRTDRGGGDSLRHSACAQLHLYRGIQQWRQLISAELREHTRLKTYLS
jgi:hypothetical protein